MKQIVEKRGEGSPKDERDLIGRRVDALYLI